VSVGGADSGVMAFALVVWRSFAACLTAFTHTLCRGPVSEVKGWVSQGEGVPGMSRTVPGAGISVLCCLGVRCCDVGACSRLCVRSPIVGCAVLHACMCVGVCLVRSIRGYAASAWRVWALVAVQYARVCRGLCCA
jgi:hypothetical protein